MARSTRANQKDVHMRDWLGRRAKKTPTDVVLFYNFFRGRGEGRQVARDLALKTDGQAWHGVH